MNQFPHGIRSPHPSVRITELHRIMHRVKMHAPCMHVRMAATQALEKKKGALAHWPLAGFRQSSFREQPEIARVGRKKRQTACHKPSPWLGWICRVFRVFWFAAYFSYLPLHRTIEPWQERFHLVLKDRPGSVSACVSGSDAANNTSDIDKTPQTNRSLACRRSNTSDNRSWEKGVEDEGAVNSKAPSRAARCLLPALPGTPALPASSTWPLVERPAKGKVPSSTFGRHPPGGTT